MAARLPVPGSDDGAWGTLLNDYLSQSLDSTGVLKAGSVGASQVTDGALPQAKIQNLTADLADKIDNSSVGTANGVASLNAEGKIPISQMSFAGDVYPISEYGFFTASAGLMHFGQISPLGGLFFARVFVPAGKAINAIATAVRTAGTFSGASGNCFCIYSNSGALLATTPVDDTMWETTGWVIAELSTPIAAQSTDRFVYASPLVVGYGSSTPYILYTTPGEQALLYGGYNKPNHRRAFYNSATSVPASIDPATYGSESNYLPLIALG